MRSGILAVFLGLALVVAGQGQAQQLYAGGGLAFTNGNSDNVSGGSGGSSLHAPELSLVFGQRFNANRAFFGWETNADFSFGSGTEGSQTGAGCDAGATGSYLCDQEVTYRLVGYLGTTLNNGLGLFGTFGVGGLNGEFADDFGSAGSGSIYGLTGSLGLSHSMFNDMEMRGEVIFDQFTNASQPGGYSSEYSATTLRVTVVKKF